MFKEVDNNSQLLEFVLHTVTYFQREQYGQGENSNFTVEKSDTTLAGDQGQHQQC